MRRDAAHGDRLEKTAQQIDGRGANIVGVGVTIVVHCYDIAIAVVAAAAAAAAVTIVGAGATAVVIAITVAVCWSRSVKRIDEYVETCCGNGFRHEETLVERQGGFGDARTADELRDFDKRRYVITSDEHRACSCKNAQQHDAGRPHINSRRLVRRR